MATKTYRLPELKDLKPVPLSDFLDAEGIQTSIRQEIGDALYITIHTKGIAEARLKSAVAKYEPPTEPPTA